MTTASTDNRVALLSFYAEVRELLTMYTTMAQGDIDLQYSRHRQQG